MENKKFKIGDRVLCINDDFRNVCPRDYKRCKFPVQGNEYTVRFALPDSIFLNEIINPILKWYVMEPSFYNHRFIKIRSNEKIETEKTEKKESQPMITIQL